LGFESALGQGVSIRSIVGTVVGPLSCGKPSRPGVSEPSTLACRAPVHEAIVPAPAPVALAQSRAPVKARSKERTYVVRKGDTLAAIARRSGNCGIREIAAANGLRGPHYPVKPGQSLKLPECAR